MRTLFLGGLAARVAPRILAKMTEPLDPTVEPLDASVWDGREDGGPWVQLHEPAAQASDALAEGMAARIPRGARGAIVCGAIADEVTGPVTRLAAACGWPVLADATSGLRRGPHERSHVVAHYDVLLRSE